jgi:prepilin-type N-terminal cleavage/methylation domain-containing protein
MLTVRRGFTLIELMLSLTMLAVVGATLCRLLWSSQRLTGIQSDRISLQSTVRGASLVVGAELRELSSVPMGSGAENDILTLSPHAVGYRAMRGFGYTCQSLAGGVLRIAPSVFTGFRDPQAGRDSLLIFAPGLLSSADSGWSPLAITAVSTAGSCPGGSALTLSTGAVLAIPAGTPVRIFEPMQLAAYQSGKESWLGMRSLATGESIQPLFGPIAEGNGFELRFIDAGGSATVTPGAVRSIVITIRGLGSEPAEAPVTEELTTQVALRNGSD